MKITKEHFQAIRDAMIQVIEDNPGFIEYREGTNLSEKRNAWDIFHASRPSGMPALRFTRDVLYKYVNDTHIDTVVLTVYREAKRKIVA